MKHSVLLFLLACCGLAYLPTVSGQQEARTALLIGCDYPGESLALPSPMKDARALAAMLKDQLGFEVILLPNPSRKQLLEGIDRFGETLGKRGGVGLFYFSGHGAQHDGENYLIPTTASLGFREDLASEAVPAQRVVTRMEAANNRVNLLFLDACRNNPLPSSRQKSALAKGLAGMNAANGMLIGFATARNTAAIDSGEGSFYTNALLKHMTTPGLSVTDMLTRVNADVRKVSNDSQVPFMEVGLSDVFAFVPAGATPRMPEAPAPAAPGASPAPEMAKLDQPYLPITPKPSAPASESSLPSTGTHFANSTGMSMRWISSLSIWVAANEVTQSQFERLTNQNPSHYHGSRRPVDSVKWGEAVDFCQRLTKAEREAGQLPNGFVYRLPYDREWSIYGRNTSASQAVFGRSSSRGTAEVGSAGTNSFGLADVRGNVWEWCLDNYSPTLNNAAARAALSSLSTNGKVLRGGSWQSKSPLMQNPDTRGSDLPDERNQSDGFRVVLAPER